MVGIYNDDFINYLKDNLGANRVKVSSRNIIMSCPWCEYNQDKNHYHLNIGLDLPVFHCFHATCEIGGTIKKLIRKIEGHDISERFIDKKSLDKIKKKKILTDGELPLSDIRMPEINIIKFPLKNLYIKKRLKFANISIPS